jgi:hypothetical protein
MTSDPNDEEVETAPPAADSDAFLKWLEKVPDPVQRYALATSELQKYQATVQRLSFLRADALADAAEDDSLSELARRLGVSRQRAHQLVSESKVRGKESMKAVKKAPTKRRKKEEKQ